jgi:sterol 24-C-methyltransferase
LEGVFAEIFRVLKPGGLFASFEWLLTDNFMPDDPEHKAIIAGIEEGDGISHMYRIPECLQALKSVGFEIVEYEDLANYDPRFEEPWYATLDGSWSLTSLSGLRMSRYQLHLLR